MNSHYNRVALFCGSRLGNSPIYAEEAKIIGKGLCDRGLNLVYGGGDAGLMGVFARSAEGANITAVIPTAFIKPSGSLHEGHTTIEVEDLFQRKSSMIFHSDAAISLPGGIGTFDEFFEVLAYNDLNRYMRPDAAIIPMIAVNIDGHFNGVKALLQKAKETGFMDPQMMDIIRWAKCSSHALEIFDDFCSKPVAPASSLMP